ncbi:hypothetical protein E1I69_12720 [Bacillus timonensis]|uniref:Uncharacterized protein n=1 Tax=Bacillus timonensis TaxID=1033734 RepID=A0A4V3V7M6_9BACI|nr:MULTISPECIES: hypothetical protein [Bacillus]MCC3355641.1 hypothetical protein [Bacillus sp. REN16]THE12023.1 hypothetical protein E1I69_12720 [Bacillus timonensis]
MGLIQKLTGSKVNRNFHIYLILMLVIYTAYVLLMNYRIKMSDVWMAKADTLTPENIESIMQYGKWSERIEISSIILFVVMGILSIITNKLWVFFKYNLILVISILMFSFVFYFITTLTIFNLLLPLMNLSSYFSILLVYVLLAKILKFRRDKKIMLFSRL